MSFSRVKGQPRAARMLSSLLSSGRIPSALLFAGPPGVGKRLLAREFAKALLCERKRKADEPCQCCPDCQAVDKGLHLDVRLIDAAYQAGLLESEPAKQRSLRVDTLRHARREMELESLHGRWKAAVVCDAHTMELEAANALLKALEEPLPKTLWILTAEASTRLPATTSSRCFLIPFSALPERLVLDLLEASGVPKARAERLARLCDGSIGRALELAQAGSGPEELRAGPLAALEAADGLPKELALARTQVELALFSLAQDLRLKHLSGRAAFTSVEKPLRELLRLRSALRSNADPRAILLLAALETEAV